MLLAGKQCTRAACSEASSFSKSVCQHNTGA
jgi:hypothetical protein